ncbi:methylmalonyl Co-A mutase-associated GTPase MeaB [Polluticoccus soli]|uniref:methylmalonyl Co-A mutase-associated GTPase MeaB n=1 Tax=Polluticoccus soli TaxID=3034150 RepID=UPI0023E10E56|nr:methylmalonyl Co-A mutase-associated GTPase MeaB [Flavipsychrobacter sp. JY13-12]
MQGKIKQLLSEIQSGSYNALARAITIVENELPGYEDLLLELQNTHQARVLGITGPPGAGKSTLVNALLQHWISKGKKIAVIAVDPSSPFNYGALLGDRIRMSEFYTNPNVFIRSLASRGALGGLHPKIIEITDLMKAAPFDLILVETVGVGQSEVEVAGLADCTVVALVPEAGDEVQTLKAGIMEIANIFVVNKADRDAAETLYRNLRIMVHEKAHNGKEIPVVKTIATESTGVSDLAEAVEQYFADHNTAPEKRLHLLTEKSWQIIQARKMQSISKSKLRNELATALADSSFNIYAFTKRFEQDIK